jgi:hypothetical protein
MDASFLVCSEVFTFELSLRLEGKTGMGMGRFLPCMQYHRRTFFSCGYLELILSFLGFLLFEAGSCCLAQADLEFMIVLPQPPESWDYR